MKQKYETYPYEFLFLINGNPIVGRNFPVFRYNRDFAKSYELKKTIDGAVEIIRNHFKNQTYDYMEKYNSFFVASTDEDYQQKDIYENEDFFTLQIRVKSKKDKKPRVIAERIFSGNDYPTDVRYNVDIRKIIPKIIEYLQQGLSMKNYTKNYCGYPLDAIFINN